MENLTIDQLFKEKRPTLKYLAAQFTTRRSGSGDHGKVIGIY